MENSLAEVRPDLAREWSDRNIKLTPDDVSYMPFLIPSLRIP